MTTINQSVTRDENGFLIDAENGIVYGLKGEPIGCSYRGGYSRIARWGRPGNLYAHRVIWESVHGKIPDGMQINHINGIKNDNRIANLEIVTPKKNMAHAVRTGLVLRGEKSPVAKLNDETVASIRDRVRSGEQRSVIARELGLSISATCFAADGTFWKHVPTPPVVNKLEKPVIAQSILDGSETYFNSAMEAVRAGGFRGGDISCCCNGKRGSHKGFRWRFA